MARYLSFFRGINVGVHNQMEVEGLRTLVELLGSDDV